MKSHSENIAPEDIRLNETAPQGFCAEPRVLSNEVWQMRRQLEAFGEALLRLTELQREMGQKLDAALQDNLFNGEAT